MINPRSMAVLIRNRATNQFEDRTRDISEIQPAGRQIEIVFNDSNKPFRYGRDRVTMLGDPKRHALTEGEWVEANLWETWVGWRLSDRYPKLAHDSGVGQSGRSSQFPASAMAL